MAAKKRGRRPKESLAAAIAAARKDPMRLHNALIDALRAGKYEQPRNAMKIWSTWRDHLYEQITQRLGKYLVNERDGKRAEKAAATRATARVHGITERHVQGILAAVRRADRMLKPYQRVLFEAQERFNANITIVNRAKKLLDTPEYEDLKGIPNTFALAFVRAHDTSKGGLSPRHKKTRTQRVANDLFPAYTGTTKKK